MRTGIIRNSEADATDTRIGLHALERYSSGREFAQVGAAIDAGYGVVGGRSIALGTGLHERTPNISLMASVFPEKEQLDFTAYCINL